jgi:5-methylcytosine-specific restriction enzyme A
MTRGTPEWIARSDNAAIPPRVRLRVFERYDGRCQCGCGRKIASGEAWDLDHTLALINGGKHKESNLRPLLREHHKAKTREDGALKSRSYKRRIRHHGLQKAKGRPLPGTKRSGIRRRMNGNVERW